MWCFQYQNFLLQKYCQVDQSKFSSFIGRILIKHFLLLIVDVNVKIMLVNVANPPVNLFKSICNRASPQFCNFLHKSLNFLQNDPNFLQNTTFPVSTSFPGVNRLSENMLRPAKDGFNTICVLVVKALHIYMCVLYSLYVNFNSSTQKVPFEWTMMA